MEDAALPDVLDLEVGVPAAELEDVVVVVLLADAADLEFVHVRAHYLGLAVLVEHTHGLAQLALLSPKDEPGPVGTEVHAGSGSPVCELEGVQALGAGHVPVFEAAF